MQHRGRVELREPRWRPIIAACAAILLVCVTSISWFYGFIQDKLFAERQAFFTQFAVKTAETIDRAFDDFWHRSQLCGEFLAFSAPDNLAELTSTLEYCSETITSGQAVVLVFTEEGEFYSSDGHSGWFGDEPVSFTAEDGTQQTAIINLPYESTENTYFLLFTDLAEPLEVADAGAITHHALAVDAESLQSVFAAQGFGDSCHTYFVTDTGRKLYQSSDSHRFIEGYNILSVLEQSAEVVGGGTMEDLLTSFETDDAAAFEISYRDESWFVSFQTVAAGSHHLIVFAPTDLIGNNAAVLSQASFWFLLFICLLLGLLFLVIAFSVRTNTVELRKMNALLEREAQAADRANRAKSEFLSYMSHDIRTPINGIMGMAGIAMRHQDDHAKVMGCLDKIDEASGHLLSLVNDVLDLSRIEQGKTAIVCEPVCLPNLLEECASIVEGQLATRNLTFVCDFGPMAHPHVMTDELHLRQILINILGNAVKFTPDGGRITFRARQEEAGEHSVSLLLEIEDTGIGMTQEYLQHIWEPFSQSRQGHCSTYEGTGLGMAITKRFVDMMDGEINVRSQLGEGSAFTVRLIVGVDDRGAQAHEAGAMDGSLEGLSVLVVEDKELNREIAREILQDAGASVAFAEDGRQALDAFTESAPGAFDVILMDVMMPVMDGLEATRKIRSSAHPEAQSMPIVALTAHAFEEDVRKTKAAGMNAHLAKPIDARDLVRVLAQYRPQPAGKAGGLGSTSEKKGALTFPAKANSAQKANPATEPSPTALEGLNILLAEDDFINMEVLRAILEDRGARVTPAENGQIAVNAFAESDSGFFDVVLMDMHMPLLDGLEATRLIRALDREDARTTPVFALTADCSDEEAQAMEAAGANGVLTKPLNVKLLAKEIAEVKSKDIAGGQA